MIYAVYRCMYGEDFVQESIKSILNHVDKVFVFWTNKPWGNVDHAIYKGKRVDFPDKFDGLLDKVKELNSEKIVILPQGENFQSIPQNLYTKLINNVVIPQYGKPDIFILPEVDHVFSNDSIGQAIKEFKESGHLVAKTRQVELWRTPEYRVPERRNRIGVVFWDMKSLKELPKTQGNGQPPYVPELNAIVHNFGFAASEKVMFWKHMTAIAFSAALRDSAPNEAWYDKWLNWSMKNNNKSLEISKGHESTIPFAYPYKPEHLPELVREKYNL